MSETVAPNGVAVNHRMDGESQRGLKKEKDVRMSNIMVRRVVFCCGDCSSV